MTLWKSARITSAPASDDVGAQLNRRYLCRYSNGYIVIVPKCQPRKMAKNIRPSTLITTLQPMIFSRFCSYLLQLLTSKISAQTTYYRQINYKKTPTKLCFRNTKPIYLHQNDSWCVRNSGEEFSIDVWPLLMFPFIIQALPIVFSLIYFILKYLNTKYFVLICYRRSLDFFLFDWIISRHVLLWIRHGQAITFLCLMLLLIDALTLTHWGRVTHMCVGNLAIIGSGNGLSPGRLQAIIWTNAGV